MDAVNGRFNTSATHCLLHQPLQKCSLFFMNRSSLSELASVWQKAFVPFNSSCILKPMLEIQLFKLLKKNQKTKPEVPLGAAMLLSLVQRR